MIHHLLYPENQFINDGIPTDKSFVQYSSISDAIQLVKQCGKCLLCCKTDIKSAFRIINTCTHQSQYKLFGFKWKNRGIILIHVCSLVLVHHVEFLNDF